MKIGIIGPHSTGKTTQLESWIKLVPDHNKITEIARKIIYKHGYKCCEDIRSVISYYKIQEDILNEQLEAEGECGPHFISDRTTIDILVYYVWRCSHSTDIPGKEHMSFIDQCIANVKNYDHIMRFPSDNKLLVDDRFRYTSEASQTIFDIILDGILKKYKIYVNNVPISTIEGRNEWFLNFLACCDEEEE